MKEGWRLINSKERALTTKPPHRWSHPPERLEASIRVGAFLKIGLETDIVGEKSERFWVKVLAILIRPSDGIKVFETIVQQDLVCNHGVKDGDELSVRYDNVFGILNSSSAVIWEA